MANSSAVMGRDCWAPPCLTLRDPFLCRPSVSVCSYYTLWFWQRCLSQTVTFHMPLAHLLVLVVSQAPLLQCSMNLRWDSTNVLFRPKPSSFTFPYHCVQSWLYIHHCSLERKTSLIKVKHIFYLWVETLLFISQFDTTSTHLNNSTLLGPIISTDVPFDKVSSTKNVVTPVEWVSDPIRGKVDNNRSTIYSTYEHILIGRLVPWAIGFTAG